MIKAVVLGASGYSGAEVLRLLSFRNDVIIEKVIAASSVGKRIDELYPAYAGLVDGEYKPYEPDTLKDIDVAFVALPSGEAMKVVPSLLSVVERVIDLSGDFRLPSASLYEQYYAHKHVAPEILCQAVYGLPELNREAIAAARLVANPGCYATSIILALLPALQESMISTYNIVVNSLSGISGAGRSASLELSFTEVNENIRAYKITAHQHVPEVEQVLKSVAQKDVRVSFVPHLVPLNRGIYTTIHAQLDSAVTENELYDLYNSFYRTAPFVRIKRQIPQIKDVVRTNYCDIGFTINQRTRQVIIISVIDNLLKGAAGQAVQNMNIMFGLPQEQGLR